MAKGPGGINVVPLDGPGHPVRWGTLLVGWKGGLMGVAFIAVIVLMGPTFHGSLTGRLVEGALLVTSIVVLASTGTRPEAQLPSEQASRRREPRKGPAQEPATPTGSRAGRRYLTHWMPPPDRALSAVGGGAVTPGPAACTGVAGVGPVAVGEPVTKTLGNVKSEPITTRTLPAGRPALRWVGKPPRALANFLALASAPAPNSMTEAETTAGPVLALPGRKPAAASACSSWPANAERPEELTTSTTIRTDVLDGLG